MMISPSGYLSPTETKEGSLPFLRLAFRPFFWLGALFSVVSLGLWGLSFTGSIQFSPFGGGFFWHAHEMLFGFSVAIIAGFLLTAVQTWTGVPSIKGPRLGVLVIIWLLARILLAFPFLISNTLITTIDLLFLPLVALFLAYPVIKSKMWSNLFFVPVLLFMAILNGLMHGSAKGLVPLSYITISHMMLLMVTLVMCIMGGRVFPMFTANGTKTERVSPLGWLEKLSIISVIASVVVVSDLTPLSSTVEASIYILASLSNFIRALRWRIWVTLKTPLVWSLHLSYWALCLGLFLLGLEKLNLLNSISIAFHTITVGGMGLMILSMISRVSLGHTGRKLQVSKFMTTAFGAMILAFAVRIAAPLFSGSYSILILLASALWCLAYGTFVVVYIPVLFSKRIDGESG